MSWFSHIAATRWATGWLVKWSAYRGDKVSKPW